MDSRDSDEQEISSSSSLSRDSTSIEHLEYFLVKSYIQNALSLLESVSFSFFTRKLLKSFESYSESCFFLWEWPHQWVAQNAPLQVAPQ